MKAGGNSLLTSQQNAIIQPGWKASEFPFIHLFRAKSAPCTQPLPVEIQRPNSQNANATQSPKQAAASRNTQLSKQRLREKNASACKGTAEEVIGREQTGRILRVAERNVHEKTLHDDETAGTVYRYANCGHNPGNICPRCEGEYKKTNCWPSGGTEGRDESLFMRVGS